MLTSDYMKPNPYTKYAEHKYYLDQLEENHTKMTKTRDNSLGNPDKLNYKLLALLVGVFCIHFYVLSLIAQQCFTFFLTTFLLNNAMALQCQHYAYHLIHFLLAHFFTFGSKLLFDKVSQLTSRLLTKVYAFAKRKYLRWSSLNIGNLCHLIQKRKIRQLICKVQKPEDKQVLISNYTNKIKKRRKRKNISRKNFFEHLQFSAYEKFKNSKNIYQKLTHDHLHITSYYHNNMDTVNWTTRNFQILTVCEVNYVEVSRTNIYGTPPHLPSPGSSQDQTSSDDVIHNTGVNNEERNNSRNPFRKIFDNGLSKRMESRSMNVGAIKNNIAKHLKNKHVLFNKMKKTGFNFQNTIMNCSRKWSQGEEFLRKEKRKFKWKKRHKEYVVFKIVSQRRMGDENELTFVAEVRNAVKDKPLKLDCECFKYDFAFGDVHEVEDKADWYMRRYERTVGKATEKSIARKDILKTLKRQAIGPIGLCSPTAYGYRDRVDPNLKSLELDWGESPKAVLCGCPVTECICDGNKRKGATTIPNAGVIDLNIPRKMVIQLVHELCGCCLDPCLRKIAPAPASTLMPRLNNAVSLRKVFYLEKRSDNLPAEMCASKCKHFYFKLEKQGFDDVAVESVHDRADSKNLDKYADDIYHDRTNEVNERLPSTKLSGTRLGSGKVSSGKVPSGTGPGGEVPGEWIDGHKVPSGRVSGQGIDGDKVSSGRVPSGRISGEGTEGDSPMIGDGLVEQEIEGAGETQLYGKDDNIYARGFILTTATQTEFDENGKLLREETDRVKIAFKLRYTTKKDLEGKQINIEICHPCAPVHPPSELTIGSLKQQIFNMKQGIEDASSRANNKTNDVLNANDTDNNNVIDSAKNTNELNIIEAEDGENTTANATNTHQDLEITPKNVVKDVKRGSCEYICKKEAFLKAQSEYVVNCDKNTCKHFENRTYSPATANIKCPCENKRQEIVTPKPSEMKTRSVLHRKMKYSAGITSDIIVHKQASGEKVKSKIEDDTKNIPTNISDSTTRISEQNKNIDVKAASKVVSSVPVNLPPETVTKDVDTAKDMTTNISDDINQTSKQKSSKTEYAENTITEVEAGIPKEHQSNPEVTTGSVTNDSETVKDASANESDNLKQTSKQKGSKTKSAKSTTSVAKARTPNDHQDSPEVTPDTVTNDADTAKDTSTNIPDSLKQTSKQKSSKTKSAKSTTSVAKATTLNDHQDSPKVTPDTVTNDSETAKDTSVNVSDNLKQTSKQKGSKTKSAKSTTSVAKARTPNDHQDSPEVTPDTVTNNADTAEDTSANVSDNLKQTSKQKGSKTKNAKSTTSVIKVRTPNEHQDSPEVTADTVTNDTDTAKDTSVNVSDNLKQTSKQKGSKTKSAKSTTSVAKARTPNDHQDSSEVTPDTVTNNADTAEDTSVNVSDNLKQTSKQKGSKTKNAKSTTSVIKVRTPNEHQDSPEVNADTVNNDTDTAKDTPPIVLDNLKQTSKKKSSKTKSTENTASVAKARTPNDHQDSSEVTPDTVTNDTDTAKDTSVNVSDNLKQTSKQKGSKTKSAKSTTSVAKARTPNDHQDSSEVTPDTVTNNADTAEDTSANVSDNLKQTSKQKGSKTKNAKSTTSVIKVRTPNEHQDSPEVNADTVNNDTDTAKDTPPIVLDNLKQTSKKKSSKTKSTENTASEVEGGALNSLNTTPDAVTKNTDNTNNTLVNLKKTFKKRSSTTKSTDADAAKDTPANDSDSIKRTSKKKSSKTKSTESTKSEKVSVTPSTNQDNIERTLDTITKTADTAKDAPASVSDNAKQSSEEKSIITKYDENTTPATAAGIASTRQNLEITPENVVNSAIKNPLRHDHEKESSLKAEYENVVECDKSTCKHLGKRSNNPEITTPVFDSNIECPCANKRQEKLKITPNTATNNEIKTQSATDHKMKDSLKDTSDIPLQKEASSEKVDGKIGNAAKNKPTNISNTEEHTSKPSKNNAMKTTSKLESSVPADLPLENTTNNADTIKEIKDSIKQTYEQKSSKNNSAENTTPKVLRTTSNKNQDNLELSPDTITSKTNTAKDTPANVSDTIKQTSEQKNNKNKSAENATLQVVGTTTNKNQDNLVVISDTVMSKTDVVKDTSAIVLDKMKQTENIANNAKGSSHEYLKVTGCDKNTCKHLSKRINDPTIATPISDGKIECPCANKRQEDLKLKSNDVTNKQFETQSESDRKMQDSLEATSDLVVHKQARSEKVDSKVGNAAKHTLTNISDTEERVFKPNNNNAMNTTSKLESNVPVDSPSENTKNNADTTKEMRVTVSDSKKQISAQKCSKTKSDENATLDVGGEKINDNQYSPDVTLDTTINDTNTTNDTPVAVSDNLKRTTQQKHSKSNTTSEKVAGKPNEYQGDPKARPDTLTKNADTAKDTPMYASDDLKQISKQNNIKKIYAENTKSEIVAGMPNKHHDSLEDVAKDTSVKVSDNSKQISKQKNNKSKSTENTISEAVVATPNKHQHNLKQTSDIVTNKADTEKVMLMNISDNLKQPSEQKGIKSAENNANEFAATTQNKKQDSRNVTPDEAMGTTSNEKDTHAAVSDNMKPTSRQKTIMSKSDENPTSNAAAGIASTRQDLEVQPENLVNNAKGISHEYICVKESSKKAHSENVVKCNKNTFKHFGNRMYDPGKTAPILKTYIKCPCAYKRHKKLKVIPKAVTDNEIKTQREPDRKITDSLETTSDTVLYKQTISEEDDSKKQGDIKNTPTNISSSTPPTSEQINNIALKITSKVTSSVPVNLAPETATNDVDTSKNMTTNVPNNTELLYKQNSTNNKYAENTTPVIGKLNKHQNDRDVTPDIVANEADIDTKTSANDSDNFKLISEQKNSTKKSILKTTLKTYESVKSTLIDRNIAKSKEIYDKNTDITKNGHINNSDFVHNSEKIRNKAGSSTKLMSEDSEESFTKDLDSKGQARRKVTSDTLDSSKINYEKRSIFETASENLEKCDNATCKYIESKMTEAIETTCDENVDVSKRFSSNILSKIEDSVKYSSKAIARTVKPFCAESCKFQDSGQDTIETVGNTAKQSSSKNEGSVRFALDKLVEYDNAGYDENDNTLKDATETTLSDNAGRLKCFCSDIHGEAENSSKFVCKKVSSVGFVFDSKIKRDDITCDDTSRQIKNATEIIPIYTTGSKDSRRGDFYSKTEDSTRATSDSLSVTLLSLKISCKSIDNVINYKVKPGTLPKTVKITRSRFNLRGKNSVKSSSDSALIGANSLKPDKHDTKNKTDESETTPLQSYNKMSDVTGTMLGAVEYSTKTTITDSVTKSENDDRPVTPLTKPPMRVDNFSEMIPPRTISIGTDADIKKKPVNSLKYCSRYCPTVKKRNKDQQMAKAENRPKIINDKRIAFTKSKSNIIDGKIQATIRTTLDLTGNNERENATVTTAGAVDNASHKEINSNKNIGKDTRDVTNKLKTETLLLHQKSNFYYCLKPETGIREEGEYVRDNEENYGKLKAFQSTKARFRGTDAKNEYEAKASSLSNERSSVYYRCRRKSKAEVNSATTMDDIEYILSIQQIKR
ncbi:uncharacterized protein [Choristoneura fumiferana]|uniref:uncharacterized protein n=1 Tax=Choristoneura fumiferana TaxID=7141 RepID=UPI003D15AD55